MVAEHKMNPPFKHHYSLPQIHFLIKIIFSTILTNLHLYITHNKYVMHTKNDKSQDTEGRSLVNIFMSPTLQFAVQERFLWLTYGLLFPWNFLSTEEWGNGDIYWMLAQTKPSLKNLDLKVGEGWSRYPKFTGLQYINQPLHSPSSTSYPKGLLGPLGM